MNQVAVQGRLYDLSLLIVKVMRSRAHIACILLVVPTQQRDICEQLISVIEVTAIEVKPDLQLVWFC